jgi:ATP-binding protein involved in chromosome partitioning
MASVTPLSFRALRERRAFEIEWSDGRHDRLSFFAVRCACPCAVCINELTGEQMLRPEHVDPDVEPRALSHSGNYAVKIDWSDGHASGIYTWERLRQLGETCPQGAAPQ